MKTEWTEYLNLIGITGLFYKRVEEILDFYQKVYPDQAEDIFVGEYIDNDGNRQYESLWIFTESKIGEAKKFLTEDDFDSTFSKKQIKYWSIKKENYDFLEASTKSRMVIRFILKYNTNGELKASRENCKYLKTIFFKYFVVNEIECA